MATRLFIILSGFLMMSAYPAERAASLPVAAITGPSGMLGEAQCAISLSKLDWLGKRVVVVE